MIAKVKFCGITNLEDAISASNLGADALGFVFYSKSSRFISPKYANEIIQKLPPFISTVGLFVNQSKSVVEDAIKTCSLNLLQFHQAH